MKINWHEVTSKPSGASILVGYQLYNLSKCFIERFILSNECSVSGRGWRKNFPVLLLTPTTKPQGLLISLGAIAGAILKRYYIVTKMENRIIYKPIGKGLMDLPFKSYYIPYSLYCFLNSITPILTYI